MKARIQIHTNLGIEAAGFTPTVCCIMLSNIPETLTEDSLCALPCAALPMGIESSHSRGLSGGPGRRANTGDTLSI